MEWLWVYALVAIIVGPIIWVFVRERRSTGAPTRDDQLNQTGIASELRNNVGRGPGVYLPRKPDDR
jgi:cytochrome c-type biogenesis protein CcmH/NrfF